MITITRAAPDIDVITDSVTLPVLGGTVVVNAFVLHGREPILVDTGIVTRSAEFVAALRTTIDPAALRWIWLTHTDFDHIGALSALLAENPALRVVTTFLGMGVMGLGAPLPMDRVTLVNPGESLAVDGRRLTAFRPPVFDNPVTTGFHDDRSGALFSSDCFGALLPEVPDRASDLPADTLHRGQVRWATIDSPWVHNVDRAALARELDAVRRMAPRMILSSHLPPADGAIVGRMLASLEAAPAAEPFVGPGQVAFEQMLAQMAGSRG